ncbi:MAG: hypothetical protein JSU84_06515 [Thiotrichales bacterium]|nr:MAG: hypothetical protein JSU84_06515 [Thiotrichales bacterium]
MGNYVNYQSVIDQLQAFGLMVNTLEVGRTTTKRVAVDTAKCPVDKEKRKSAGWYKLNAFSIDGNTYIVGSFGYWKGSDNNAVKVEWKKEWSDNLTPEQRKAMADAYKASVKKAEEQRKREIDRCARRAVAAWNKYITTGESPYLQKKQVGAFGVKFDPFGKGTLAVPVTDVKGKVYALQIVRSNLPENSSKRPKQFWPYGAEISGHFHVIGNLSGAKTIFIVEGYATGASVHMATDMPVVIAFNANNLPAVAKEISKAYPSAKIVIGADDDYLRECPHCKEWTLAEDPNCSHCGKPHKKRNDGVYWAEIAATSVGGEWVKPDFMVAGTDIRNGEKLTDFNDLHVHPQGGLHLVTTQIAQYVTGTLPKPTTATSAGGDKQGEGVGDYRSVISLHEAVKRFIPLIDGTGKYLFDTETNKITHKDQMLALLEAGIRWDDIKRNALWQSRGAYGFDQVGFDPAGDDANCKLNTWSGWPTKPANLKSAADGCKHLIGLLYHLCSNEKNQTEALFDWILNWVAYPIQHPGAKMQTAVVVHGPQGTGKSRFFEAVGRIYGEYSIVLNQGAIEDKFNSDWTSRKLFIIADEIVARQDMYHLKNQLKAFITGDWVRVNPKNLAAYKERNHMNLVFLSNEKQPVILENDDRRHCVIYTPQKLDESYYDLVSEEIENGGIEALHQFLLERDLTGFKPWTKPPMTESKQDLIDLGKDSIEIFIEQWQSGELGLPVCPAMGVDFYDAYQKWCKRTGEYEQKERFMNNWIDKSSVLNRQRTNIYLSGNRVTARLIIPSDEFLVTALKNGANTVEKIEGEGESRYLSKSVTEFRQVKNGDK